MNTNEQYKGFSIAFRTNGITIDSGRYFVKAEGFNVEGYATLNNAKGAITKHLKAVVQDAIAESVDVPVEEKFAHIKSRTDTARGVMVFDIEAVQGAIVGKKVTGIITDGLNPPSDKRSRNQREGGYSGKFAEFNATFSKVSVRHRRAGATGNYDILKDIKHTRCVGL